MDDFWEASWACLPGSTALRRAPGPLGRWKKIADSHVDSYFCFHMRFFAILEGFWNDFRTFWEAKMDAKNRFLGGFSENVDFLKIVVFPEENYYFLGFGPTNSMKIR